MSNDEQRASWNGLSGERWVEYQDEMDENLRPLGAVALAAADVKPGERVLDVGCGCGDTTLLLAARVGTQGRVTGVDLSAPMLTRARERATGLSQVSFLEADAQVAPLPEVDLVFSRFGVMFFDDPVRAFSRLKGALRKDGRLAFVCWRSPPENAWVKVPAEAMSAHLPAEPAPDPNAPGPFAFASRSRVEHILSDAGFRDIHLEPFDSVLYWTRSPHVEVGVDFLSRMGPASRRLNDVSDDVRARAMSSLREALQPYQQADGLALGSAVWIVTAR